jgi:hypothetical protein
MNKFSTNRSTDATFERRTPRRSSLRAVQAFMRDSAEWGVTPGQALLLVLAPLLPTLIFIGALPFPQIYHALTDEDALLEWLQFLLIFPSSILFGLVSQRIFKRGWRAVGVLYLLVALGACFVAGEEISWGQRIFGWSTPETLGAINAQNETTLHNIGSIHEAFLYAVALVGLYGVVAPLAGALLAGDRLRPAWMFLFVPPLCLVPAFFMPFGFRLTRLLLQPELLYPRWGFAIIKFSEVTELCLYFALLVFAWLCLRRLGREAQ